MTATLTSLTLNSKVAISGAAQKSLDESTPQQEISVSNKLTFKHSVSTGLKADEYFEDRRAIAAGATDTIDLAGTLTNAFGQTITFSKVRGIYILNTSNNQTLGGSNAAAGLQVGGNANEFQGPMGAAGDLIDIEASNIDGDDGGELLITNPSTAGWAVTAGTADALDITNKDGSNAAEYVIIIWGESA